MAEITSNWHIQTEYPAVVLPSLIGPAQLDLAEWSQFSSFSVKLWKDFSEAELQKQFQRLSWSSVGETEEYHSCVN